MSRLNFLVTFVAVILLLSLSCTKRTSEDTSDEPVVEQAADSLLNDSSVVDSILVDSVKEDVEVDSL